MNENKHDLLVENHKRNSNILISKKKFPTDYPKKNESLVKFIIKKPLLFNVENTLNLSKKKKENSGKWSNDEHDKFLNGLELYGINWKKFNNLIKTRTLLQVRSHAQKFYLKMKLCKNEDLGINFTLNSIRNLNDMINQIKSINNNYNIVNIFKYLNNEYDNSKGKFKKRAIDVNIFNVEINDEVNKINVNKENKKKDNIINLEENIIGFKNANFFLDNIIEINEILNYDEELSSNDEINIPKQFFQKINSMIFIK